MGAKRADGEGDGEGGGHFAVLKKGGSIVQQGEGKEEDECADEEEKSARSERAKCERMGKIEA